MLNRVAIAVALELSLLGCGPRGAGEGGPVPLLTVETQTSFGSCVLDLFYVADVIADPTSGTPTDAATGEPFAWPKGFTARRAGPEVEVFNRGGNVVLTTGTRYRMCPPPDDAGFVWNAARSSRGGWVIGMVDECRSCELGGYGHPGNFPDCTANPTDAGCQPPPNATQ